MRRAHLPHRTPVPREPEQPEEHTGGAYEVMYLLDAARRPRSRGCGPCSPVSATRSSSSATVSSGTSTSTPTTSAPALEAGIAAGRPHRIRVTALRDAAHARVLGPPSAAASSSRTARARPCWLSPRPAPPASRRPGRRRRPRASCSRASGGPASARSCCCPATPETSTGGGGGRRGRHARTACGSAVIPTRSSVQALAALAVHDAGRRVRRRRDRDDRRPRTRPATAAVTIAVREAITMAGACRPGDVLGVVDGDFAGSAAACRRCRGWSWTGCSAVRWRAGHPGHRRDRRDAGPELVAGSGAGCAATTPASTRRLRRRAAALTRCSSVWSDVLTRLRQLPAGPTTSATVVGARTAKPLAADLGLGPSTTCCGTTRAATWTAGADRPSRACEVGEQVTVAGARCCASEIKDYVDRRTRKVARRQEAVVTDGTRHADARLLQASRGGSDKELEPGRLGLFAGKVDGVQPGSASSPHPEYQLARRRGRRRGGGDVRRRG